MEDLQTASLEQTVEVLQSRVEELEHFVHTLIDEYQSISMLLVEIADSQKKIISRVKKWPFVEIQK